MADDADQVEREIQEWMRSNPFGYARPKHLARELLLTRAEVELALRVLQYRGIVASRRDGRWYSISPVERAMARAGSR